MSICLIHTRIYSCIHVKAYKYLYKSSVNDRAYIECSVQVHAYIRCPVIFLYILDAVNIHAYLCAP